MPELRRDRLSGRWVSYAPERAKRPMPAHEGSALLDDPENCPFCPGHEHMTAPATLAVLKEGSGLVLRRENGEERSKDWLVRIVPNLYPAFSPQDTLILDGEKIPATGFHEVLIDTPKHYGDPWKLDVEELYAILLAAETRLRELESMAEIKAVAFAKNHGPFSGGSLRHPHTHLVALPIVPPLLESEAEALRKEGCVLCAESESPRLVLSSEGFKAFTSHAGREPYELIVAPKRHEREFTQVSEEELHELAEVLLKLFKAVHRVLGESSFNLVLHTMPKTVKDFHWHIELIPRLLLPTGIDVGLQVYVNTLPPEEAAKRLREALE